MNWPMKKMSLVALLLVLASGCKELMSMLSSSFKEPAFNFKKLDLTDISLGGLNLDTVWALDNPNQVGISLASIDYALFVEQKQVVAGAPQQGFQIAPNATSDLHFPAGIKFADIAQVVSTFLTKDNATWKAEGGLGISTPIGTIRLPIAKEGLFEIPKIPGVQFGSPKVSNMGLTGATIEFPLTVTNKNTYGLPVNGLVGDIKLGGASLGKLSTGDLGAMAGKGDKMVTLPLQINFLSAGTAVMKMISGGNSQLKFDAQVQSGTQQMPIQVDQLVNFIK
jgi:LEA14-like dessication related protein